MHQTNVTFQQYDSTDFSFAEPEMVLSERSANLKHMFGPLIKVIPKKSRKRPLTITEYDFRKYVLFVTKHSIPAARSSTELRIGRRAFFPPEMPRKYVQAKRIMQSEMILTGSLKTIRHKNTHMG